MKAIIITQPGDPEVLKPEERPTPIPSPGEVLIKVSAAGLNRLDIYQRKGNYPAPQGAPQDIPGLEVAGVISATGENVERWKVGDKVCALIAGGGYAEYCVVPEGQCLPVPDGFTFEEAASLPETYFTIWYNVYRLGKLKAGESLLVHGGSSGIGISAIHIATALGSNVYITAGTDEKCAFCLEQGAAGAINYNTEDFTEKIKSFTGGRGVDVILDMIGAKYFPGNIASLADDGRLVFINTMQGREAQVDLSVIMRRRLTITGSTMRSREPEFKSQLAYEVEQNIWPLLNARKIKPVIHRVFDAADAAEAHKLMESSTHSGKIILRFQAT
ncbi:NAD(P)H-quinone oxidoreductase [Mucilaginibacter limnophilus]|uniref:NAD(P)H-quinone oxidoreductase n=1 Tax=Mucilaginibacter limnophilus TaxID=1932778 RepID=A0A437MQZ8_9SPHI|nr:NAD(P)H-quinone oxidoreductase [Mucilaginibacter limnophilus]RVU00074.1 NAD(P)H-quinone oxidoreductase [Mucilaginibacter limnophilus]